MRSVFDLLSVRFSAIDANLDLSSRSKERLAFCYQLGSNFNNPRPYDGPYHSFFRMLSFHRTSYGRLIYVGFYAR